MRKAEQKLREERIVQIARREGSIDIDAVVERFHSSRGSARDVLERLAFVGLLRRTDKGVYTA